MMKTCQACWQKKMDTFTCPKCGKTVCMTCLFEGKQDHCPLCDADLSKYDIEGKQWLPS